MVASSAPEPVFRDLGPVQVMAIELRVPLSPPAVSSYRLPSTGAGTCQIPDKIVLFGLSRQSHWARALSWWEQGSSTAPPPGLSPLDKSPPSVPSLYAPSCTDGELHPSQGVLSISE